MRKRAHTAGKQELEWKGPEQVLCHTHNQYQTVADTEEQLNIVT